MKHLFSILFFFCIVGSVVGQKDSTLVPYFNGDKWGYMNLEHELVIPCKFDSVSFMNKHSAIVKVGNNYGLINRNGDYLFEPREGTYLRRHFHLYYKKSSISADENGQLHWNYYNYETGWTCNTYRNKSKRTLSNKLILENYKTGKFTLIDTSQTILDSIVFDNIYIINDSLFYYSNVSKKEGFRDSVIESGIINNDFQKVLKGNYVYITEEENGYFVAYTEVSKKRSGTNLHSDLLNQDLEPIFVDVKRISCGKTFIIVDSEIYNYELEKIYSIESGTGGIEGKDFPENSLICIRNKKSKYGIINTEGDTIIPFEFDKLLKVSKNYYSLYDKASGKYALINHHAEFVSGFVYNQIPFFLYGSKAYKENLVPNEIFEKWLLSSKTQTENLLNIYLYAQNDSILQIIERDSVGLPFSKSIFLNINSDTVFVSNSIDTRLHSFDGYIHIYENKLRGILNSRYEYIIYPSTYLRISCLPNNMFRVSNFSEKEGVISYDGSRIVLDTIYDNIYLLQGRFTMSKLYNSFVVYKDGKCALYDSLGTQLIGFNNIGYKYFDDYGILKVNVTEDSTVYLNGNLEVLNFTDSMDNMFSKDAESISISKIITNTDLNISVEIDTNGMIIINKYGIKPLSFYFEEPLQFDFRFYDEYNFILKKTFYNNIINKNCQSEVVKNDAIKEKVLINGYIETQTFDNKYFVSYNNDIRKVISKSDFKILFSNIQYSYDIPMSIYSGVFFLNINQSYKSKKGINEIKKYCKENRTSVILYYKKENLYKVITPEGILENIIYLSPCNFEKRYSLIQLETEGFSFYIDFEGYVYFEGLN